jgi:hypothetical protein
MFAAFIRKHRFREVSTTFSKIRVESSRNVKKHLYGFNAARSSRLENIEQGSFFEISTGFSKNLDDSLEYSYLALLNLAVDLGETCFGRLVQIGLAISPNDRDEIEEPKKNGEIEET